ncbi:MAG: HAMP domain-containing histidine kinase [Magnetococcales bacterium]|nr:HAMP domain-containing histidine kinase [Magnetococcales bacterium]
MLELLYHLSLGSSVLLCGVLALAVGRWAGTAPGARQLADYLLGTLAGIAGFWLIAIPGAWTETAGSLLAGSSPWVAALFLRFACHFGGGAGRNIRNLVVAGFVIGGVTTLMAWWQGLGPVFTPGELPGGLDLSQIGWMTIAITLGLTLMGQFQLLLALNTAHPGEQRRIRAVIAASLWGFGAMSGFLFPAMGWQLFPYPVLLLPGYPILLAYGLLRHQVMAANLWAQRALAWLLLTVPITVAAMAVLALVTTPDSATRTNGADPKAWLFQFLSLTAAFGLTETARRLANRIIYPGAELESWPAQAWRTELNLCADHPSLAVAAGKILTRHLHMPVSVIVRAERSDPSEDWEKHPIPLLLCQPESDTWICTFAGWQDAPLGPRLVAERFGHLVAEAAEGITQARQRAEAARLAERERHLTALGLLAATVAHELRNPLNVIAMVATQTPPETREELRTQLRRMDFLIADLLDYAKAWQVAPESIELEPALDNALSAFPGVIIQRAVPAGIRIKADPRRLGQLLANLLANAVRALASRPGPEPGVRIEALNQEGGTLLIVSNQGLPIPEGLHERIFQPFVSRFEGGTGLGLAIVARIMEAHGGRVELVEQPGWSCCFQLFFPDHEERR